MITSSDIFKEYISLYSCLREYIWDIDTISDIVDLEDSICIRFPNIEEIKVNLDKISKDCKSIKDDDSLQDALSSFKKTLDVNFDDMFAYLYINFID